jgi:L-rhamnose mutarotase
LGINFHTIDPAYFKFKMKKYCLTLDLKDDPALITEYEKHHIAIWPEIHQSITASGITNMEIYRYDTRLFMIMETDETFSFEKKGAADAVNPKVQEWEDLMWKYQQPLKNALKGEKWVLMNKIFQL